MRYLPIINLIFIVLILLFQGCTSEQTNKKTIDNSIYSFRANLPISQKDIEYIDIDKDGDPDILKYTINDTVPIQWIDDDDDMTWTDLTGDNDSDCLMCDVDNDGNYGHGLDLIVDWNDEDGDGIADMQAILENSEIDYKGKYKSHYMYIINTDNKGIFSFIDWDTYRVEMWEMTGRSNFLSNYHGNSILIKAHISSFDIEDIRYNWENPFLFYDEDEDGYSEMAIRLVDEEVETDDKNSYSFKYTGMCSLAQLTFDMDNDNGPANEIDYDMSLKFYGEGFDYSNQVHTFKSMKGLEGTDAYFHDTRYRQNTELIYCNHDSAYEFVFNKGEWEGCWLVFDEDDDCHRWERVEFYDMLDPFRIGARNGGLDHNPQSDVSGDRGEWDTDFSGGGNLYISPIDGKIHLLGAELGYWRIDQFAKFYQGWQGWRGPNIQPEDLVCIEPETAPIIKYEDTDGNGFFDLIAYDMDANKEFEEIVSLIELGISDTMKVVFTKNMSYGDYNNMYIEAANANWNSAMIAIDIAKRYGVDMEVYRPLLKQSSIREKYSNGFWLTYYTYNDLLEYCNANSNNDLALKIKKAYYSGNWEELNN